MFLDYLPVWISSLIVPFQIKLLEYFTTFYLGFIWKLQSMASNKVAIPT
jgi:hypothetical protein